MFVVGFGGVDGEVDEGVKDANEGSCGEEVGTE